MTYENPLLASYKQLSNGSTIPRKVSTFLNQLKDLELITDEHIESVNVTAENSRRLNRRIYIQCNVKEQEVYETIEDTLKPKGFRIAQHLEEGKEVTLITRNNLEIDGRHKIFQFKFKTNEKNEVMNIVNLRVYSLKSPKQIEYEGDEIVKAKLKLRKQAKSRTYILTI